jgi:hypothetical protein
VRSHSLFPIFKCIITTVCNIQNVLIWETIFSGMFLQKVNRLYSYLLSSYKLIKGKWVSLQTFTKSIFPYNYVWTPCDHKNVIFYLKQKRQNEMKNVRVWIWSPGPHFFLSRVLSRTVISATQTTDDYFY